MAQLRDLVQLMRLALILGFFLASLGFAAAQTDELPQPMPEAALEAFYAPYLSGNLPEDQSGFFSERLNGLYARDTELTPAGEIGAITFDPFVDGQDFQLADFAIGAAQLAGNMATVDVGFSNFGEARSLTYEFVLEEDGWKIDDVVSTTPGSDYRLSQIFAEAAQHQVIEPRAGDCAEDNCSITFPE